MKRIPSEITVPTSGRDSTSSTDRGHRQSSTSITPTPDRRWSEIVPPDSGLTFAVVWDPEDGILAFSGAQLLESSDDDIRSPNSPSDAYDNRSQVLTIGQSTIPVSENTATLAVFRDTHQSLFPARTPTNFDRNRQCRTQTSSTMGGVDVYLRGSLLGIAHLNCRHFSCLDKLGQDFEFDPRTAFANRWSDGSTSSLHESVGVRKDSVSDEGFFEGRQPDRASQDGAVLVELNLSSAFSTTTTSTSNYISVELEDDDYTPATATWSTLEAPNTPIFARQMLHGHSNDNRHSRRLKKRRPAETPASPYEVLQRDEYNHEVEPPLLTATQLTSCPAVLPKFVRSLGKWKRNSSNEQWVFIDVTQEITQHYV